MCRAEGLREGIAGGMAGGGAGVAVGVEIVASGGTAVGVAVVGDAVQLEEVSELAILVGYGDLFLYGAGVGFFELHDLLF